MKYAYTEHTDRQTDRQTDTHTGYKIQKLRDEHTKCTLHVVLYSISVIAVMMMML